MTRKRFHWIIRLFPQAWQVRYGEEFLALLEIEGVSLAILIDLLRTATGEWVITLIARRRRPVLAGPKSTQSQLPPISGFIPIYLSLAALAVVVLSIILNGVTPGRDEDAFAHIYQILIAAEVPVVGFFVVRWIRTSFWLCFRILVVQAIALATALLPVWLLHL